ncbi:histone-like nucleoid-structuring protein Lsr2 [Actinomadura sp. 3N407]|uniref:histone-like nucleoid-structuring protein Lsr2 n=1 Tax=Actinomadura sp. 3N407 TaxID=3457423 RepID=UPI003FCCF4E2
MVNREYALLFAGSVISVKKGRKTQMARQVLITKIDDIDGTPAGESVRFGLDGRSYEIDLSEANKDTLRGIYAPYIAKARKVGARRGRRSSTAGRHGTLGRERAADIRA